MRAQSNFVKSAVSKTIFFIGLIFLVISTFSVAEEYRGVRIAPENRCTPYERSDYPYLQSVEDRIISSLGKIYGPYTERCFASKRDTDIEHIVATSEAHDSGMCGMSDSVKKAFATDLLNLTLASATVNRYQKSGKDVAEWRPDKNACWFVARTLEVRRKYNLTIDRREVNAVEAILSQCADTDMNVVQCSTLVSTQSASAPSDDPVLEQFDDNRNGRITCAEARKHGITPVKRDHPAYKYMSDGDGDGVVCE